MLRLAAVKRFVSNTGVRIYRIPCEVLPGLSGRVYLLLGAGPPTLVDAGSGEGPSTPQILAGLDAVGRDFGEAFRPQDIRRVLVTHGHIDHIGGLWDVLQVATTNLRSVPEVAVHPLERRMITAWDERSVLFNQGFRRFLRQAGVEPEAHAGLVRVLGFTRGRVRSVPVARVLDANDDKNEPLDGLRIIHTPGHAPGHVCIAVGNVLLTGDHILARTISQQWPERMVPNTGLGHYLDSLDKIARLEGIDLALGSHESPIHDLPARISELRSTHLRRLDRILDIIRKAADPPTIAQITRQMYSRQQGLHALLALTDVGARVEYLELRGHLELANLDEIDREEDAARRYRGA
jgi:glyoxylase-like metal-dependent hydrolase (beta-lactamase superfamily II)